MTVHDCSRGEEIGDLKATMRFFQDMEKRREEREVRLVSAMETIATQGAAHAEALRSHGDTLTRQEKAIGEIFQRLRKIETPATLLGYRKLLGSTTTKCVAAALTGGFIVEMVRNPDNAVKIIKAFTGN